MSLIFFHGHRSLDAILYKSPDLHLRAGWRSGLMMLLFFMLWNFPALTQGFSILADASQGPLEIEADDGFEWNQNERQYVAIGNVVLRRGDLSIQADKIIAQYGVIDGKPGEIEELIARGNVLLKSSNERAEGTEALYNIASGYLRILGPKARLVTGQDQLKAEKSIEYWEPDMVAVMTGKAQAVRYDRLIRADRLEGYFRRNPDRTVSIRRIIAHDKVCLEGENEIILGGFADYDLDSGYAIMQSSQIGSAQELVQIYRGSDKIQGNTAEINLITGISRLIGRADRKRVYGSGTERFLRQSSSLQQDSIKVVGIIHPDSFDTSRTKSTSDKNVVTDIPVRCL